MLNTLHIQNFGIINRVSLEFEQKLNVLTGETGSGKSIILDALLVALGGRASTELIRYGEKKALVEAEFNSKDLPAVNRILLEAGIQPEEDGTLILSREINHSGKNTCRVNGRGVTLTLYRELGKYLIDMHGQHQQQSLLNVEKHRQLLDNYGGKKHLDLVQATVDCYQQWRDVNKKYLQMAANEQDKSRKTDLLLYQLEEITNANIMLEEDEHLESEIKFLVNAEKVISLVNESYLYLYDGDSRQAPVIDQLGKTINILESLTEYGHEFNNMKLILETALYQIEDIARDLADYRSKIEFDPQRLQVVENRLDLINRLKRKYGNSIQEILEFKEKAKTELDELNNSQEKVNELSELNAELEDQLLKVAEKLTLSRQAISSKFEKAISIELQSLEMPAAKIQVDISPGEKTGRYGKDKIEFLFTANPGEPLRSLARIASGGELSRVMLALKALLAEVDEIPTLVFDEVDSGIGGRALQAVAEKLFHISQHRQVICVTHAAPIAAYAAKHFRVAKQVTDNLTLACVNELNEKERVDEIARMLGGKDITSLTREHARHLLKKTAGISE